MWVIESLARGIRGSLWRRPRIKRAGEWLGLRDHLYGVGVDGLSKSLGMRVSGIEAVAGDPLQSLVVFLMVGICNGVEELVVAPGATDVLGRTASGCFNKARIDDAWNGIGDAFDTY